jgi:L-ascorbate metabolism protein UlaG (beta-lactamase superfamily)
MQLQLVRNATLKLGYGGRTILVDPYLAPKHSLPSFTGRSPNPMAELPMPVEDILEGVDLVIVSHLHTDHFDSVAKERVPKDLPLICQPGDEETIRRAGFTVQWVPEARMQHRRRRATGSRSGSATPPRDAPRRVGRPRSRVPRSDAGRRRRSARARRGRTPEPGAATT